jgi:Restriction endonuclease NotI
MKTRGGFGIAEWYGRDVAAISPDERQGLAAAAIQHNKGSHPMLLCPFVQEMMPGATCNKKGGVCSIRSYDTGKGGAISGAPPTVIVCPQRFLEGGKLLRWVAQTMLGTSNALAIKETPFLRRVGKSVSERSASTAGRIDWLLVDKAASKKVAALETQSLYFSGANMLGDFEKFLQGDGEFFLPPVGRRPDYRSGGPKRLSPQLVVKVPTLRNWGIKMAVLVDDFFFGEMSALPASTLGSQADSLENAEIVWFVCRYEDGHLVPGEIHYATLNDSVTAMNAASPMKKSEFDKKLQSDLRKPANQGKKVFNLE